MDMPTTLGPYEIVAPLSGGAMGTVYRARRRDDDEIVAIKSVAVPVRVQLASLRREIQALQAIEHPNVVAIHEHGLHPIPWYAMELVRGLTLGQHARTTPVEERWRRYVGLVCDVCNGLAYLHGLGMVHRDLKPGNVMVRDNDAPEPGAGVLVDFGLATVNAGGVGRELLYKRSDIVGTPQYMAPEQVQQQPVDARSDLYALGCILFELVCGAPPFPAKVPIVAMLAHVNESPQFPDDVVARTPPRLRELILALLEKRPQDRPGYAVDVRDMLAEIAEAAPPTVAPPPAQYLYRPRLVGRDGLDAELDEIAASFPATAGGLVVIRGAAGAGKSRLAIELIRRVHVAREASVEVLMAESTPDEARASSFESMRRVFDEIADWCVERGSVATRDLLGMDGVHLGRLFDNVATLPGVAGEEPPAIDAREFEDRMCEAVTNVLTRFARQRPIVLVIDDLQWSDALTRRWLARLEWHRPWDEAPILVVVAGRYGDFLLDALTHHPNARPFRVGPLDLDGVEKMVRDMIAVDEVPPEFSVGVMERSQGYPTRIAEWMHEAVRRGVLRREEGEWRFAGRKLDDEQVRRTITIDVPIGEILRRRIESLDAELRRALQLVAVVGVTIPNDVFERLRERCPAVDRLVIEGLLEEVGRGDVRFGDPRLQEYALETLDEAERVEAHRQIVEALQTLLPHVDAALLARHLAAAGAVEDAMSVLDEAAVESAGRGEYARVALLYEQFFQIRPEDAPPTPRSIEARARQARALLAKGERESAHELLARAEAHAEECDDAGAVGAVLLVRGTLQRQANELGPAIATLDDAYRRLRSAERHREAREALIEIGNCWCRQGRFEVGRDVYQRALDWATQDTDAAGIADATASMGLTYISTRNYDEAVARLADAARKFHDLGDLAREAYALLHLGQALADVGDYERAMDVLHTAYEIRYATGDTRGGAVSLLHFGHAALGAGHIEQAIEVLTSCLPILERLGERHQLAVAHGYLGEALGTQPGCADDAMEHFAAAITIHRSLPHSQLHPYVYVEMAKLHRRLSLYADAQHYLERALEVAEEDDFFHVAHAIERARLEIAVSGGTDVSIARLREKTNGMRLPTGSALTIAVDRLEETLRSEPEARVHGELPSHLPG